MKKHLLYAIAGTQLLAGCLSSKVAPDTLDASFMHQETDGKVILTSYDSAIQTKIIKHQRIGDTLLITYRKGVFLTSDNMIPLTAQIHYLKCAGRLYKVASTPTGFQLDPL